MASHSSQSAIKVSYLFRKGDKGLHKLEGAMDEAEQGRLAAKAMPGRKVLLEPEVCLAPLHLWHHFWDLLFFLS